MWKILRPHNISQYTEDDALWALRYERKAAVCDCQGSKYLNRLSINPGIGAFPLFPSRMCGGC